MVLRPPRQPPRDPFYPITSELTMCQYLGDKAPNAKKKGTLFSSTLKVGENNVALVF